MMGIRSILWEWITAVREQTRKPTELNRFLWPATAAAMAAPVEAAAVAVAVAAAEELQRPKIGPTVRKVVKTFAKAGGI